MKQFYFFFLLLMAMNAHAQTAIINEFSADPSMYDGSGGEFVELYCPAGGGACDISCWVVSDGQGLITIPDGTIIPDGGFYLIAHAPAFNCDSCDFFGSPVDLNTATCGCLSGGSYGTGIDGNPSFIIGRFGNAGELMLLYNNVGALMESWSFDNASAAHLPLGGPINGSAVGTCPAMTTVIPPADSTIITDIGPICLGCNTSYTRDADGSGTWVIDDHPTPGGSNANRGDNAFLYQYRIDGGPWITIPKNGANNIDTHRDTVCSGDSIEFRIQIENYQHAVLEVFDSSGRYGSYFRSPTGGIMAWANVSGVSTALDDTLRLQSNPDSIALGAISTYVLQWSDYKDGLGSYSSTSNNECYERMTFTLVRNQMIDSATVICTDPTSGISQVTAYPIGVDGQGTDVEYVLYDDIGDLSNPIDSNQSGAFQLSVAATTGYYIQVQGLCNNVIAIDLGAFCLAIPPCPQIDSSYFLKNSAICGAGSTIIHTEDFEGPIDVGYSSFGVFSDGSNDYFDLQGDATIPDPTGVPAYTGQSGSNYWAGEDTQDGDNPVASGISGISITGINITGAAGLQLDGLFGAGSSAAFDDPDFVQIFAQINGGGFVLIGAFEGTGGFNSSLNLDTDLDGVGDAPALTTALQNFTFPIAGTGTTLDLRIDVFMSAGDEAIAFDNLIISGIAIDTCQACPLDTLTFGITGTNLPQGGFIDWYYDTTAGFSPYNGDGTYIGSSPIPPASACSSPTLVINEFFYRPLTNNGTNPDAGEAIELLGPPGMDIGCFVITDGDWTITIPPGTVIPPDGIFTIGNDAVWGAGTFDLDAENCGCFTDGAGGDGLLILTDGGEYFGVFDATGTFVQGVIYGAPSAGNTPPMGANTVGGVINTIGTGGCPSSVTIPAAAAFEVTATTGTNGTSIIRDPDGTGPWNTQAGGSINSCNLLTAPALVPEFDYLVPLDACDETRIYKGIITPHPNTVACPNTDPTAFTEEFVVEVVCPDAHLEGDYTLCATALPLAIPLTTTDILSGTGASFVHLVDGVLDTVNGTVVNDTLFFNATTTGVYDALQIIPATGCIGPADSFATVVIVPTPPTPSIPSPYDVCEGDTALLVASGATTYEWSLFSNFSPIDTINSEYLIAAPDSVYLRSVNQDDSARVSCPGPSIAVAIDTHLCDVIILAPELLAFNATKIEKEALLSWQWMSKTVGQDFYIERSADGIQFDYLGVVAPVSNPTGALEQYQLWDSNPILGWNYYRLRYPIDANNYQYSAIRALYFGEAAAVISVYPSPTKGMVTIGFADLLLVDSEIKVYDVLGQVILNKMITKGVRQVDLDLVTLPAAVYVLSIETGLSTQNIRIIKQ